MKPIIGITPEIAEDGKISFQTVKGETYTLTVPERLGYIFIYQLGLLIRRRLVSNNLLS